ncbi:hypothetical protein BDF14DRAFT_1381079 [Spinellus fusiger]|nr:hypothetical protein BDF14DRAFT_1381079 [Spinellus fusiger]
MSSATSTLPLGVTPDVFANYTPTPSSLLRPSSSQSMSIRENVHVMIRCRPSTGDEEGCWVVGPKEGAIELSGSTRHVFQFDSVLTGVDNSEIYNAGIRSLVR